MQAKNIIFDCFGVICHPPISGWYMNHAKKFSFIDYNLNNTLVDFDLNKISEDQLFEYFSKYPFVNSNKEKLRDEIDSYLGIDHELVEYIKKIKKEGHKIFLLSNANHNFFERKVYKDFPEFKNLFDDIIISSEIGMVKPNRDIFMFLLDKHSLNSEDCIFIDDNKVNVEAAENVGILSYLYKNFDEFEVFFENQLGKN